MIGKKSTSHLVHSPFRKKAGLRLGTVCLLLLLGCSAASDRRGVEGTVTLDSGPLAKGSITFRPIEGTRGPTAGANITAGEFSISEDQGPFVGNYRVEITATRETGRQIRDPISKTMVDEFEQYIPTRYNQQSELTASITENGPNRFEFQLTSK